MQYALGWSPCHGRHSHQTTMTYYMSNEILIGVIAFLRPRDPACILERFRKRIHERRSTCCLRLTRAPADAGRGKDVPFLNRLVETAGTMMYI